MYVRIKYLDAAQAGLGQLGAGYIAGAQHIAGTAK